MQAASLLLLGEAVGDGDVVKEAARQIDTWIQLTQQSGVSEYDSSTYTPVQIGCLEVAYNTTTHGELKPRLKACLDYLWSDIAANYFPGRGALAGPQSRLYNLLFGDENINQLDYLSGLRRELPAETLLSDDVRIWTNVATPLGYRPGATILSLAGIAERTVQERFGPNPGADRYNDLTTDFALGSVSRYHGPQDKQISLDFATTKKLPSIKMVVDAFDAPYGKLKVAGKSGHSKPRHLKDNLVAVQEKGTVLALVDLSPETRGTEQDSVATNLIFPVHADAVYLDGKKLSGDLPFEQPASKDSVLVVREGKAAAALRIFAADGVAGKPPRFAVEYDGNEWGAGRLVAYHYQGSKETLPPGLIRAGIYLHAEHCDNDFAFQDFQRRARAI